jgi:mRNA interferase MazF
MNVGSVHWVELPGANGHEQQGRRPAIVLQSDVFSGRLPTLLVVPLTSTRKALRFSGTVLVNPTSQNGLRQESVALVFQLRAIDRLRVKGKVGELSAQDVTAVFTELDRLTGRIG